MIPELNKIYQGDCLSVMASWPDNFVDTIITDPPYGLSFMGKTWDHGVPGIPFWAEMLRICKPGALCLSFGGTRTFHRMAVAIEDAGWQIRDCLTWLYGSGFPKGHRFVTNIWDNVIQCQLRNNAPLVVQTSKCFRLRLNGKKGPIVLARARILPEGEEALLMEIGRAEDSLEVMVISLSALKIEPTDLSMTSSWKELSGVDYDEVNTSTIAIESDPIIEKKILNFLIGMTMPKNTPHSAIIANGKPWFACSVVSNSIDEKSKPNVIPLLTVLGTATENPVKGFAGHNTNLKPAWEPIIVAMKPLDGTFAENAEKWGVAGINVDGGRIAGEPRTTHANGNKPATGGYSGGFDSLPLDRRTSAPSGRWPSNLLLDEEAAAMLDCQSGNTKSGDLTGQPRTENKIYGSASNTLGSPRFYNGARFFYVAKADRAERNEGCDELPKKTSGMVSNTSGQHITRRDGGAPELSGNNHPTVKPLSLMKYLCNLTRTPTGGIVLDPFCGSGTTLWAAEFHNRPWIGIEMNVEYVAIANARIAKERSQLKFA